MKKVKAEKGRPVIVTTELTEKETLESENTQLRAQLAEAREVIGFYGAHFYVGKTDPAAVENGFPETFQIRTPQLYEDHGQKARDYLAKWAKPVEGEK